MLIISQPRYLPALNYIQRINFSKTFVILDDVQRQARGWENRNKLLINGEAKWLTIPINSSKRALINSSYIGGTEWINQHISIIEANYKKAPYFQQNLLLKYYEGLDHLIENEAPFSKVILQSLINICDIFELPNNFILSSELGEKVKEAKAVNKLVAISEETNSTLYISGPNGKEYGVDEAFEESGISVKYHDYKPLNYSHFNRPEHIPYLGFFDALFNIGKEELKKHLTEKPSFYE